MKVPLASYHIDWLQVYCHCEIDPVDMVPILPVSLVSPHADGNGHHREYRLEETTQYAHGYKWSRVVMWRNFTIAYISAIPSMEGRDYHGASIRLANPVLYTSLWYHVFMDVVDVLHWKVQNITRIDLACDQNFFLNGLHPATFLRQYACKLRSFLRVGRLADDFSLHGSKTQQSLDYNYIRWGTRSSGVCVYLYNKSKELKEIKEKPWIRKAWESDGLASNKDVWRVEVSITSQGLGLKSMADGIFHTLFVDDLKTPDSVRQMFQVYASKYFRFVRNDPKIKYKKDLPEVQLLNLGTKLPYRPFTLSVMASAGRAERTTAKKLRDLELYLYDAEMPAQQRADLLAAVRSTSTYFNDLYLIKDAASYNERKFVKEVHNSVLEELSVPIQTDRLHTSATISHYYESVRQSVLSKAKDALKNLHDSPSPPTPTESEQPNPTQPPQLPQPN